MEVAARWRILSFNRQSDCGPDVSVGQFTGNVIPAAWYRTIPEIMGKPNLTAIIILSDVVYWYRPVEIRDELTGQLCDSEKEIQRYFTEKLPAACRSVWNLKRKL